MKTIVGGQILFRKGGMRAIFDIGFHLYGKLFFQ